MSKRLNYQISEYDCGPTSLLNGLAYVMPRKHIDPEILRYVHLYTLDGLNGRGEYGKHGTSRLAMSLLSQVLNRYAQVKRRQLYCQTLAVDEIDFSPESPVVRALELGAAAVLRLYHTVPHYVLLTGLAEDGRVLVFDPYYENPPLCNRMIRPEHKHPERYNYVVDWACLNRENRGLYSMGPRAERECLLLFPSYGPPAAWLREEDGLQMSAAAGGKHEATP